MCPFFTSTFTRLQDIRKDGVNITSNNDILVARDFFTKSFCSNLRICLVDRKSQPTVLTVGLKKSPVHLQPF